MNCVMVGGVGTKTCSPKPKVKVLWGPFGDSSEAGHVECHVDRPHDLVERYALHARDNEGASQGALVYPGGLRVEGHRLQLGDMWGGHLTGFRCNIITATLSVISWGLCMCKFIPK